MDTATHFAFGFGLAGLSQLDPNVTADAWSTLAVMIGTVAGSQAPDADTLLRLRSATSIMCGTIAELSHSIPAWFFWTALISGAVWLALPTVPFATLAGWTFLAVMIHVATDLFNTYGTQAMRPITRRWISWNIIHIFDPFVFGAHLAAIAVWATGIWRTGVVFAVLYGVLAAYYVWRTIVHMRTERLLPTLDPSPQEGSQYTAIPTVHWKVWNVVRKDEGGYTIGVWKNGQLRWTDRYVCESTPLIEASKKHPAVASFLSFSSHPCPKEVRRGNSTIVRWVDARYQHRKQYPFLAVIKYNGDGVPVYSYVGWISEEKLEQRLRDTPSSTLLSSATGR